MTTQQTTWQEYTGSDEQIAEISNCKYGFIVKGGFEEGKNTYYAGDFEDSFDFEEWLADASISHYWIIPDDPLREMKIRWAQTGQPVWVRECRSPGVKTRSFVYETINPDWNIPNAEYSFTPWED